MSTISDSTEKKPSDKVICPRKRSGCWKSPSNVKGSSSDVPSSSTLITASTRKWYDAATASASRAAATISAAVSWLGMGAGVDTPGVAGTGVAVGAGVGVGTGVAVGAGVGVGSGVAVGAGVAVGEGVGVGLSSPETPHAATAASANSSAANVKASLVIFVSPAAPRPVVRGTQPPALSMLAHAADRIGGRPAMRGGIGAP